MEWLESELNLDSLRSFTCKVYVLRNSHFVTAIAFRGKLWMQYVSCGWWAFYTMLVLFYFCSFPHSESNAVMWLKTVAFWHQYINKYKKVHLLLFQMIHVYIVRGYKRLPDCLFGRWQIKMTLWRRDAEQYVYRLRPPDNLASSWESPLNIRLVLYIHYRSEIWRCKAP